jgi:nucleoside-diphosphate-sugar epimerase
MNRKVFLAGATGAIGKRLVLLLVDAGYEVFGTTRSESKAAGIEAAGATPMVVDARPLVASLLGGQGPSLIF